MLRSATRFNVSVSVALLFAGLDSTAPGGGAMVAVLVTLPVAFGEIVAVNEYVAVPFTARSTVVLMLPVPLAEPQLEPAEAVQVQLAFVKLAGRLSATAAPVIALGPELETTMV